MSLTKINFPKVNGTVLNGKGLEVIINGELAFLPVVQTNTRDAPTHYRLVKSKIGEEKTAYKIINPENYMNEARETITKRIEEKFQGAEIQVNYR